MRRRVRRAPHCFAAADDALGDRGGQVFRGCPERPHFARDSPIHSVPVESMLDCVQSFFEVGLRLIDQMGWRCWIKDP